MSFSLARDIIQQVRRLILGGLVGPHDHSANHGGPISTDLSITITNPFVRPIITRSQILNENLNADLWRGKRYYAQKKAPVYANYSDLWFDGITLWQWNGWKWVSPIINFDVNGALIGSRGTLNLIQGSNTTITGVDNSAQNRVDITVSATGGAHNLLDGVQNQDTVAYSPTNGDMIIGSGNKWIGLVAGAATYILTISGGLPSWQPPAPSTSSLLRDMIALGT